METAMERLKGREEGSGETVTKPAGTKRPVSMREKYAEEGAEEEEDDDLEEEAPPKKKGRKAAAKPKTKRKAPAKRGKKNNA